MSVNFGTSKKSDGQMRLLSWSEAVENRRRFFGSLGFDPTRVVATLLEQGTRINVVSTSDIGSDFKHGDGLITNEKNLCLTVTVADCLPIFFHDESRGAIGIAHAGWKGVVKNIASVMVEKMEQEFDCDPQSLKVSIGPHIKSCHFKIQENILFEFSAYQKFVSRRDGEIFVDLEKIVRGQLLEAGVGEANLEISKVCTACDQEYFSYRRDNPEEVVSQVAYIWRE